MHNKNCLKLHLHEVDRSDLKPFVRIVALCLAASAGQISFHTQQNLVCVTQGTRKSDFPLFSCSKSTHSHLRQICFVRLFRGWASRLHVTVLIIIIDRELMEITRTRDEAISVTRRLICRLYSATMYNMYILRIHRRRQDRKQRLEWFSKWWDALPEIAFDWMEGDTLQIFVHYFCVFCICACVWLCVNACVVGEHFHFSNLRLPTRTKKKLSKCKLFC